MASHCQDTIYSVIIHGQSVPVFLWNFVGQTMAPSLIRGIYVMGDTMSLFDNDLGYRDLFGSTLPFCQYMNMIASDLGSHAIRRVFSKAVFPQNKDPKHDLIEDVLHPIEACHMHVMVEEGIPYGKFKEFIDSIVQTSTQADRAWRLDYMHNHPGISRVAKLLSEDAFQKYLAMQSQTPLIPESQRAEILSCYAEYVRSHPNSTAQLHNAIAALQTHNEHVDVETAASLTNGLMSLGVGYFAGFGVGAIQTCLQACLGNNNSNFFYEILLSLLLSTNASPQTGLDWIHLLLPYISALGSDTIFSQPSAALLFAQVIQYAFAELTSPIYPEVDKEFSVQMIKTIMQMLCHTSSLLGHYHGVTYQDKVNAKVNAMTQSARVQTSYWSSSIALFARTTQDTVTSCMQSASAYLWPQQG